MVKISPQEIQERRSRMAIAKEKIEELANSLKCPVAFKDDFEYDKTKCIIKFSDLTERHIWYTIKTTLKNDTFLEIIPQLVSTDHSLLNTSNDLT